MALLLLSPLVIAPLALQLVSDEQQGAFESQLWRWIATLQLPAALALMLAFIILQGLLLAKYLEDKEDKGT